MVITKQSINIVIQIASVTASISILTPVVLLGLMDQLKN